MRRSILLLLVVVLVSLAAALAGNGLASADSGPWVIATNTPRLSADIAPRLAAIYAPSGQAQLFVNT